MRKVFTISIIALLLCGIELTSIALAATPQAGNTSQEWPHADQWAGQLNMSKYNNYNPSHVVKPVFNGTWVQSHPGSVLLDPSKIANKNLTVFNLSDTKFISNHTAQVKRSPAQIAMLKQFVAKNSAPNAVQDTTDTPYSNVYITEATYTWYWVQDEWGDNEITIYNAGPLPASGMVIVWSAEDNYGYGSYYNNLGVGSYATISVPYLPAQGTSVGLKPIILAVEVGSEISDEVQVPDGIEMYSNAAGHLTDPYGGDSLATSDLYHFPFGDGYRILYEAAVAGDNTYVPNDTAYNVMNYVNGIMRYNESYPWTSYTASDLYITSHGAANGSYFGVCDEYATLYTSFERSLGVPTQYYLMTFNNNTGYIFGHAITQIWNGNSWISVDPTWDSFNNPQVYKQAGCLNVSLTRMSGANDSKDLSGPIEGAGLLNTWTDFNTIQYLGIVPEYN